MIPIRSVIKATPSISRMVMPVRPVISGPPANRISFAEKFITGVFMMGAISFIPAWVLVHIRDYQGKE